VITVSLFYELCLLARAALSQDCLVQWVYGPMSKTSSSVAVLRINMRYVRSFVMNDRQNALPAQTPSKYAQILRAPGAPPTACVAVEPGANYRHLFISWRNLFRLNSTTHWWAPQGKAITVRNNAVRRTNWRRAYDNDVPLLLYLNHWPSAKNTACHLRLSMKIVSVSARQSHHEHPIRYLMNTNHTAPRGRLKVVVKCRARHVPPQPIITCHSPQ